MPTPDEPSEAFNWDEEVGTRADAQVGKALYFVVNRAWVTYSGTEETQAMRNLFGGRFTHLAFFPRVEEGKVYAVPAGPKQKGAEKVTEYRSRKTLGFNILAGLARFRLKRIKGTNMVFKVTPQEQTRYGKAMVLDVNSLESKAIKPRTSGKK